MKYYCCGCDRELVAGMAITTYIERNDDKGYLLCPECIKAHWDWHAKLKRAETRHNRLRMPKVYEDTDIGKPKLLSLPTFPQGTLVGIEDEELGISAITEIKNVKILKTPGEMERTRDEHYSTDTATFVSVHTAVCGCGRAEKKR